MQNGLLKESSMITQSFSRMLKVHIGRHNCGNCRIGLRRYHLRKKSLAMCEPIKHEDWLKQISQVDSQLRQIRKAEKPLSEALIHCACGHYTKFIYLYRCLYCSVWFCKTCAEEHFGQTVEEYRKKHPIETQTPAQKES